MEQTPLISIIVPVYNVAQWLDTCVTSILAQDWENTEIILVDDGSKDDSGQLCDCWAEKDARIRVIHKENGGLSSARNAALDVVTGDYIMFVDSDDLLHPQICSCLYRVMNTNGAQIAICDPSHIFGTAPAQFETSEQTQVFSPIEAIRTLWYQHSFLPSACAKLYSRNVFASLRFTEGLLYEDIDLMHLLFWEAEKVVYTPAKLYGYMHRENSITTRAFSQRDLDILKVADKILSFASDIAGELLPAARSYAVVAALRVVLNAPKTLSEGHTHAKALLRVYGWQVMKDPVSRTKTRCGLLLYFFCRPLMRHIYKRVDRWKS